MPLDETENKTANKVINSKTGNRDNNKVSSRRSRVSKVNRANAGNKDKMDSRDNKDKKEKVRVNNRAASSQVNNKVDNSRLVVRKTVGNHSVIDNE